MPRPIDPSLMMTVLRECNKLLEKRGFYMDIHRRKTLAGDRYSVLLRTLDGQLWGYCSEGYGAQLTVFALRFHLNQLMIIEKVESESSWYREKKEEQQRGNIYDYNG